jgi:hypothetical protein
MCDSNGYQPGHLVMFDVKTKEAKIWEKLPAGEKKFTGFNPHGGDYDKTRGLIVSDFVLPVSFFSKSPTVYRDTVRLFGTDGVQKAIFTMPGAKGGGYIATKWIGNGYAIAAASASHNEMYIIDTNANKVTEAFPLSTSTVVLLASVLVSLWSTLP